MGYFNDELLRKNREFYNKRQYNLRDKLIRSLLATNDKMRFPSNKAKGYVSKETDLINRLLDAIKPTKKSTPPPSD